MNLQEAMNARNSVRSYTDKKIEGDTLAQLRQAVDECNNSSGLRIQLMTNEPTAFTSMMAKYGKFKGVKNYIALVGKKGKSLEETCGYYGEKIALAAQQLGLNTCWVAMSFSKGKSKKSIHIASGEKLLMVIAIGYGETQGVKHKSKSVEALSNVSADSPEWFRNGIAAAQLAPTAMNQQKFKFELSGDKVIASAGSGFYAKTDLGIAKYHFEVGAGSTNVKWAY